MALRNAKARYLVLKQKVTEFKD